VSDEETIRLDQFMKLANMVRSGGEAKHLIQNGKVLVNGEVETRRSRKLRAGDSVTFNGETVVVGVEED
jgi:ribosome-associated protein